VDSTSASSSGGTPVSGEHVPRTLIYVNNIHSFLLLSLIVLSFFQLIYIYIDLLKVVSDAGESPTNPAHKSNSRGADGIPAEGSPP
jgi:hypothetical protein